MKKISIILLLFLMMYNYAESIELSGNAMKNYGIKTTVTNGKNITLPRSALVVYRDEYYIYLKNGEEYEEMQIFPTKVTKEIVTFTQDTAEEREFVISGAPYLRIIFLNSDEAAE